MDVYWSIEVCGWVRSPAAPDALSTPWSRRPAEPAVPVDVLPQQRDDEPVPAER